MDKEKQISAGEKKKNAKIESEGLR